MIQRYNVKSDYTDSDGFASSLWHSRLGGVVVSVLAIGPKGHGLKPGLADGFLMAIKVHSTPSFGWKVKLEAPCHKILRHVKEPYVS
jgi:hypothetical protein